MFVSNLLRYHRRSHAKAEHDSFQPLSEFDQNKVRFLAGILRIADNLDRGHREFVNHLVVNVYSEKIIIEVHAVNDVEMEMKFASDNAGLLEAISERKIQIVQV